MPANSTTKTTTTTTFTTFLSQKSGNDDGSSSNSCDENQNTVECPHINKSVDLQKIRKAIIKPNTAVGFTTDCEECKKKPNNSNEIEMNGDYEVEMSLWMCLK